MSHRPELSPSGLDTYLHRIGFSGSVEPTLATLASLHQGHLDRIPFENIDVRLGRPVRLDLEALEEKLTRRRRGGYCFEQNTLFAAVLERIGFQVQTLEARVRPTGAKTTLPRTHMTLAVDADGRRWVADVGFGGDGPLRPVPLDGEVSRQEDAAYRVAREEGGALVLERHGGSAWADLYAFSPVPALPVDFELANYFTSTHPNSIFVKTLTVQKSRPQERHFLRGRTYTVRRDGKEAVREIADHELPALLEEVFGLELGADEIREVARLTARSEAPGRA